jgi:hypothetical protein
MNPLNDSPSTDTERWLLAPAFDPSNWDIEAENWADDESLMGPDAHLTDFGSSVLADVLSGVDDAVAGLDQDVVNRAHAHLMACATCSIRVDSITGWSASLKRETNLSARVERANPGNSSPAGVVGTAGVVGAVGVVGAPVVSLSEARAKKRFPRFLVPVAASLAAVALGGVTLLRSNVDTNTSNVAAAADTSVAAAAETSVAALAQERSKVADSQAAAPETVVAAATAEEAPAPAPAQDANDQPPAAALTPPPATSAPDDFTIGDGVTPVVPSIPAGPPQGGTKDQAGVGAPVEPVKPVDPADPENKTGQRSAGALPRLVGSFETFDQAAARLRAVPTAAVRTIEPPCRTVLQRLLTELGADPDEARFARADIAGELVTLAIVQDKTGAFQVVGADTACKPVQ